jgi:hypothetical protein
MTSPDGINWTARTAPSPDNSAWRSITYGDGLFVAVASSGTHKVMTSPDGINWTARTVPSPDDSGWLSVTYGNGLFVAGAASGTHKVMTSPDGINWSSKTSISTFNQPIFSGGTTVTFTEGVFFMTSGSNYFWFSFDAIKWKYIKLPWNYVAGFGVLYTAEKFVFLSSTSYIVSEPIL